MKHNTKSTLTGMVAALGLFSGATLANAGSLEGSYSKGPLKLTFAEDGKYTVHMQGRLGITGTYELADGVVAMTDISGPISCKAGAGHYKYERSEGKLSMSPQKDPCSDRKGGISGNWSQE